MMASIAPSPPHPGSRALVAGATGVAGRSIVDVLVDAGWEVVALSRNIAHDPRPQVTALPVDLLDAQLLSDALSSQPISHLFYAVQYRERIARSKDVTNLEKLRRQLHLAGKLMPILGLVPGAKSAIYRRVSREAGSADPQRTNLRLFRSVLAALETPKHDLRHVALITGGKHYGMHLGPALYPDYQTEFIEDAPRAPGPNWYYDIEDDLIARRPDWTWTVFRPSFIVGYARDAPYNLGTTLATYAALRKARGEPLLFFGDRSNRELRWDITSARQLAEMMLWSVDVDRAHGEAFNCTTGQPFRWEDVWPKLAAWFDMEPVFRNKSFPVRPFFEENSDLWNNLIQTHALRDHDLRSLSSDDFVDRAMTMNWEAVFSMNKAHSAGFPKGSGPARVFIDLFQQLVDEQVIPNPRNGTGDT